MSSDANYDSLYADAMAAIRMHTTLTDRDELTDTNRKRVERRRKYRARFTDAKDSLRCGGTFVDSAFCITIAVQKGDVTVTTALPSTAAFNTGTLDFTDVSEVSFVSDALSELQPPLPTTIISVKSEKRPRKRTAE